MPRKEIIKKVAYRLTPWLLLIIFLVVIYIASDPESMQFKRLDKAIAEKDIDKIIDIIESPHYTVKVRWEGARGLFKIGTPEAITWLLNEGLRSYSHHTVVSGFTSPDSDYINDPKVISRFKQLLQNPTWRSRTHLLSCLELNCNKNLVPDIILLLKDMDVKIRYFAYDTLVEITGVSFGFPEGMDISYSEIGDEEIKYFDKAYEEYLAWWNDNEKYLYWCKKHKQFEIDEEAKKAGIPTE